MVHARHVVPRMGHAHVGHGQQARRAQCRHLGLHAGTWRQGGERIAAAVHGFGEQGVGLVLPGLDDHVVGLGHGDTQLIDHHRLHIVAVGLHHGHGQARNAQIEIAHARAVDDAQAHPLARFKQRGPVLLGVMAVDQKTEAADVGDIGFHHAHAAPVPTVLHGRRQAIAADLGEEVAKGLLLVVVVVGLFFQIGQGALGLLVLPVEQQHGVLAVVAVRLTPLGFDDQRPVQAFLFLEVGVGVVPVGAGLVQGKAVGEGLAGLDTGKAHPRHAVLGIGQDDAVPVQGRHAVQFIGDGDLYRFAFLEAQFRRRALAVDGQRRARTVAEVHPALVYHQLVAAGVRRQAKAQQRGGEQRPHQGATFILPTMPAW